MIKALTLFALILAGCSSKTTFEPQVSAAVGDTFVLRVGQEVNLQGEGLRILFEAVTEDSRCPQNVTCVWEGNGQVRLRVSSSNEVARIDLNTTVPQRADTVFNYQIALEKLDPYPIESGRIPADEYRAHLRVTR